MRKWCETKILGKIKENKGKYWLTLFLFFLLVFSIYLIGLSGTVPTVTPIVTGTHPMDTTIVNITPSSQFVSPNGTFTVNITVDPGEPIGAVGADLSFNSSLITADSVAVGDLFDPYPQLPDNGTINNTAGTITGMYNIIMGNDTVSSPGTFMEITFTASSAGTSYLDMSNVMVMNGDSVPFTVNNGNIIVTKTYVNITPSSQFVSPNETFTVNITVDPGEPIGAVGADLSFDPSLITADSVAVGDLFDPYPQLTYTGWINNAAGTITWMINIISGPDTVSSPGTFMEITFTAGPLPGSPYLNLSNVMIVNSAGRPFTVNNGYVTIDTIPPITKKTVGEPKYNVSGDWYVKSTTEFNLTATDDGGVAYIKYRIWSTTSGWTDWMIYDGNFTLPDECLHYIEYYSVDNIGNVENVTNQTYYVDDTPPIATKDVGEPNIPDTGFTWITSNTEFTSSAVDAGCQGGVGMDTLEYRIWYDGSWSDWTTYVSPFKMTGECIHYLEVRAKDKLGNEELDNETFYLDDTAPTSSADTILPYWHNETQVPFEITATASDDGCKGGAGIKEVALYYRYSTDNLSWNSWAVYDTNDTEEPYNWSFTGSDGYYQFYSISTDNVGNVEDLPTTADAIAGVDTLPPTIEVIYPKGGELVSGIVTIKWIATDIVNLNGTIWIQYSDDNGSTWNEIARELNNTGEYDWDTTTVPDGSEYLIMVNATNDFHNTVSNESSSVFIIDNTQPMINIEQPRGHLYIFDMEIIPLLCNKTMIIGRITIKINATDATSGIERVEFFIDNESKYNDTEYPYNWSWNETAFFRHSIKVVAYDKAGNEATDEIEVVIFNIKN